MDNTIDIDPFTRRDVMKRAMDAYGKVRGRIMQEMGEEMFCAMGWEDIAMLFWYNGFTNGAITTATDADFRDTVLLMKDEIDYQKG